MDPRRISRTAKVTLALWGLVSSILPSAGVERQLGAHHMVTLPWAGGAAHLQPLFDTEAQNWKDAGFDFVILHMDAYDGHYPAQLRAYYDACAKVGVKACASWTWFDRASATGDLAAAWIPQIVRDTKDHPAQWKIDGVPVYSAYNLQPYTQQILQDAGLWPVKIWGHSYYYAAGVGKLHWSNDANVIRNTYDTLPWVDGLCNFSGDMSAAQITSLNRLLVDVGAERGKMTMGGVTPFYGSHHLWDMSGFRGLETQWEGILQRPPDTVWWVTSNDWRELSYVSALPVSPVWSNHWNTHDMPPLLDHTGYAKFAEPFIAAYKAGQSAPTFSADRLFLAYQLHPKDAAPVAGSPSHVFGGRAWRGALPDRIFASAHLTAPARLRINGVLSNEFPAGVAHFDIPLTVGSEPDVAIVRNGADVKSGRGPLPITNSVLIGAWNYLVVEVSGSTSGGSTGGGSTTIGTLESSDIGSPALAGSTSHSSGTFTIRGGGSDIWGGSDQFHFTRQQISGDAELIVRVQSLEQTDIWAKAGLMLRSSSSPSAAHVSVFVTPANGVCVQWRSSDGKGESLTSNGNGESAPRWLKLSRSGSTFTAFSSSDGTSWAQLHAVAISLPNSLLGGLAVTSHNNGSLSTAVFTGFSIVGAPTTGSGGSSGGDPAPPPPPTGGALETGDIGSPALAGSTTFDASAGRFTVLAAGSDIWEGSDQFHFARRQVDGNADLVVRVESLAQTDVWAKAGLMLRSSSSPSAAHVSVFVTPANGVRFQWRNTDGSAESLTNNGSSETAPRWIRLTRSGNTFTAFSSSNGTAWTQLHTHAVALPTSLLGGLAVTSHNAGSRTTAVFSSLSFSGAAPSGSTGASGGSTGGGSTGGGSTGGGSTGGGSTTVGTLETGDVGSPALAGSTSVSSGTFTIRAGGSDIWGGSDQFHFARQQVDGDADLIVRVESLEQTDVWAKAGLMLRSSSSPSAAHVSVFVTPANGVRFQWRNTDGSAESLTNNGSSETAPRWIRLTRSGHTFTAFSSSNGTAWTQLHTHAVALPTSLLGGLAVTSHNAGSLTTAVFSSLSFSGAAPSGTTGASGGSAGSSGGGGTTTAGTLETGDIGSPVLAGSTSISSGTFTLHAGGNDIWGGSDQFHFARQQVNGDADLIVRVESLAQTDVWAKAGLMLRSSSSSGAAHVSVFVTPGNGVRVQWRTTDGATETFSSSGNAETAPRWIRLNRSGNTFTAFSSPNGTAWTQLHAFSLTLPNSLLGGLAVTSHNTGSLTTAAFSSLSFSGVAPSGATSASSASAGGTGGATTDLVQIDVGNPDLPGSTLFDPPTAKYFMEAGGRDIWSDSDQFQFAHRQLTGDCKLIVRVTSLAPTNIWAKAGLMIRTSLAANSAHASTFVTPGSGVVLQARGVSGGQSGTTSPSSGGAPQWLRLERRGNTFTAYRSSSGATWDLVGTVSASMPATVYVGLAATSHESLLLTTAVFDNLSITTP